MLYHWYELDLEATLPAEAGRYAHALSPAPVISFDKAKALQQATSGGCVMNAAQLQMIAVNDTRPDAIAATLRAAGLGVIGDPAHRAHPGSYSVAQQVRNLLDSLAATTAALPSRLGEHVRKIRRRLAADRSHTMVSNERDDYAVASNGAKRQRFESSGQSSAN